MRSHEVMRNLFYSKVRICVMTSGVFLGRLYSWNVIFFLSDDISDVTLAKAQSSRLWVLRGVSLAFEARDWCSDYIDKRCVNSTTVIKVSFFLLFSGRTFPLCFKKLLSWCLGACDSVCASFRSKVCRLQVAKDFLKESQDLPKLLDLKDPT